MYISFTTLYAQLESNYIYYKNKKDNSLHRLMQQVHNALTPRIFVSPLAFRNTRKTGADRSFRYSLSLEILEQETTPYTHIYITGPASPQPCTF